MSEKLNLNELVDALLKDKEVEYTKTGSDFRSSDLNKHCTLDRIREYLSLNDYRIAPKYEDMNPSNAYDALLMIKNLYTKRIQYYTCVEGKWKDIRDADTLVTSIKNDRTMRMERTNA